MSSAHESIVRNMIAEFENFAMHRYIAVEMFCAAGCPYGDHNARITRKNDDGEEQTFTCSSYVETHGHFHCLNEPRFRQYCCESCQ